MVLNLGINGALPADLELLTRQLALCGIDVLVLDTHLRPFSGDFTAPGEQMARPWLADLPLPEADVSGVTGTGLRRSAVLAHRDLVQARVMHSRWMRTGSELRRRVIGTSSDDDNFLAEQVLLMKLKHRLASVDLSAENPQRLAMERLLGFATAQGIPTLVFYARENPELLSSLIDNESYAEHYAKLVAIIDADASPLRSYVPPVEALNPSLYLDFSHLDAQGYEILADAMMPELLRLLGAAGGE